MALQMIQVDDLQLICYLLSGGDGPLLVYFHDQLNENSYSEHLPKTEFQKRIRQLNKRVHFPIKVVRTALNTSNPIEATWSTQQKESVDGEEAKSEGEEVQEQEQEPEVECSVLSLKYRIQGAPAPLKWEWHLTAVDSTIFYRSVLKSTLNAAAYLNENMMALLEIVKKKDIELKQYRIEGAQLRRTTVATEPFNVEAFYERHSELLSNVGSYEQFEQVLDNEPAEESCIKSETSSSKAADAATTIPCRSSPIESAKALSPRNRKRKAMETGIQHVERKVMQRRRVPQLQYKNTQSQEDDFEDSLPEIKPTVKSEADTLIVETEQEPCIVIAIETDPEPTLTIESSSKELDEIMQLIKRATEETNKMLDQHNVT